MTQPAELHELALDLEKVHLTVEHARIYVHGHDQADGARLLANGIPQSALRTALEHGATALERIIDRLRQLADSPPPPGPSSRDGGPL